MTTYTQWNYALVKYFTSNVPHGSSIFITVNDETLIEVAANFLEGNVDPNNAGNDFVEAVRRHVVRGDRVNIQPIAGQARQEFPPSGIAFLGVMVLAAHRMGGDHEIDPSNYFLQLTNLLQVDTGQGNRPLGLGTGDEEQLWQFWNQWLQSHGWQPTARRGPDGYRKYVNYVLTQALLRDDDKTYLKNKFRQNFGPGGIWGNMDEVQLAGWLQRTDKITRRYLREGFQNSDVRRAAAFYEAAYKVYETALLDEKERTQFGAARSRIINAGLIRSVSLLGQVTYRIFIPQPTNWIPKSLSIKSPDGVDIQLIPGRLGHFQPVWKQQPFIGETQRFALEGDPLLEAVVLPIRDFWILMTDPEDSSGALATWEKFPNLLGKKFSVIFRLTGSEPFLEEMEKFQKAGLIGWDGEPQPDTSTETIEYRGCMVLSSAWDGIFPSPDCAGLYEALKPKQFASISLSGGIRVPGQNAWLVDTPPRVKLFGFEEHFGLRLLCGEDEISHSPQQPRQVPLDIISPTLPAGNYNLEVDWNGQLLATRSFRLANWEDLELASQDAYESLTITSTGRQLKVSGAVLETWGP